MEDSWGRADCKAGTQTCACGGQGRGSMGTRRSILRNHRASYKYLLRASLPLLFDVFLLFTSNPLMLLLFLSYLFFPLCFCVCLRAASQKRFKRKTERWSGTLGRRSGTLKRRLGTLKRRLGTSGGQRLPSCQHAALQQHMMGNAGCHDVVGDPNYSLWGRGQWGLLLLSSDPHLSNLQEIGLPVMPNPCQSQRNPGKRLRN